MLQTLLNSCPLIVKLIIEDCTGLINIELRNLQNIKSIYITTDGYQRVTIQAPSLEHLYYSGNFYSGNVYSGNLNGCPAMLDVVECWNLKSLELKRMRIYDGFLQHLISRSQSLESLKLVHVYKELERLNICGGQSLRVLKIISCKGIGEIDAPNLISLEYEGDQIPELKIAAKEHSQIDLHCSKLNAAWIRKLREILSYSSSWSQVSLSFDRYKKINLKEMQLHHAVATPQVDDLDVVLIKSCGGKCPALVDALFWLCHPRRLNLRTSSIEIITSFVDCLLYMKKSRYSTSHESKVWRSQLKEVKAFSFDNWKDELVELRKSEKLAIRSLEREEEIICFLLDW